MYTYVPAYASLQYLFLKKMLDLEGCLSTLAAVFFILGQALTYRLASIVLTVKVFTLLSLKRTYLLQSRQKKRSQKI